jgi:hypothetical protein
LAFSLGAFCRHGSIDRSALRSSEGFIHCQLTCLCRWFGGAVLHGSIIFVRKGASLQQRFANI